MNHYTVNPTLKQFSFSIVENMTAHALLFLVRLSSQIGVETQEK